jgi:isopenicillin N synthase-like dioxygenase
LDGGTLSCDAAPSQPRFVNLQVRLPTLFPRDVWLNRSLSFRRVSLPFFFEPSFTAQVAPLPAANRILKKEGRPVGQYRPTQYGDFLLGKVGANFVQGGKKEKY